MSAGCSHRAAPWASPWRRCLRAVVRLATLDDVLRFARRSGAHLNVEHKNLPGDPGFDATSRSAEELAARLLRSGIPAHRLTVQSFWPDDMIVLGARLPGVRRSLLVAADQAQVGIEIADVVGADAFGLEWPVAPDVIRAGHECGLYVMAYTINRADDVRAAARAGADAIITDDPATARMALTSCSRVVKASRRARAAPLW